MKNNLTNNRKKDHLEISINENIDFSKTTGFEKYEFVHYAITEVIYEKINLKTKFFNSTIDYPFLISAMTGGSKESENINHELAIIAETLKIPIGVGSQRQAMENDIFHNSFKVIRKNAKTVPILANLGAAELCKIKDYSIINKLIDLIEANAFVIHLNSTQELFQKEGTPIFFGLLTSLESLVKKINIPIIVKEVGNGISYISAKKMLEVGILGIDVAGAGGTSWQKIEMIRNNTKHSDYFGDWGLPTAFCVKEVANLKDEFDFLLIASGGINSGIDIAKSIALGADIAGSAKNVLKPLINFGINETVKLLLNWFEDIKRVMYLTGTKNLNELDRTKIIKKEDLF